MQSWRIYAAPSPSARATRSENTYRARRRYDAKPPAPLLGADGQPLPAPDPDAPPKAKNQIAIIGDSLAEALTLGFEATPIIQNDFTIHRRTSSASGLVRQDYHDWPKALTELTKATPDLAAIIVMLGLNDRQIMSGDGNQTLEPLSEPWRTKYRERIDGLVNTAKLARVPLIWVGLPAMRSTKLSSELAEISGMIRERIVAQGEIFVDITDAFSDSGGGFSQTGPDIIGDIVRLRGPDGIHFTPAGQRKLAFWVERPLRKLLSDRLATPQAPSTTPAPLAPEAPATPEANPGIALAPDQPPPTPRNTLTDIVIPIAPADTLAIPILRRRPAIGETRALNQISGAKDLVTRAQTGFDDPLPRELFDRGLPPEPTPGRADDFTWR